MPTTLWHGKYNDIATPGCYHVLMHTQGMKNVVKAVRKVGQGKVWFGQLRDKRKNLFLILICRINIYYIYAERSNLYYSMKNCGGIPDKLRETILNLIQHYQASSIGGKVFN